MPTILGQHGRLGGGDKSRRAANTSEGAALHSCPTDSSWYQCGGLADPEPVMGSGSHQLNGGEVKGRICTQASKMDSVSDGML